MSRKELRTTERVLEDKRDASWIDIDLGRIKQDGSWQNVVLLKSKVRVADEAGDEVMAEFQAGYLPIIEFIPEEIELREFMDTVVAQVCEVKVARAMVAEMVGPLRTAMTNRDQHIRVWYRSSGAVKIGVWLLALCATRMMIGMGFQALKEAAMELDESMGAIFGGRKVPGLKINSAFKEFEEQELLQAVGWVNGVVGTGTGEAGGDGSSGVAGGAVDAGC